MLGQNYIWNVILMKKMDKLYLTMPWYIFFNHKNMIQFQYMHVHKSNCPTIIDILKQQIYGLFMHKLRC